MTGCIVVDASFAFRLIVPGPTQALYLEQAARWGEGGCALYAPTLWLYEMTSALCKLARLSELTQDEARQALALVPELGVQLVSPDSLLARSALEWTLRLNRAAAYDSFYLALAEALECELWTADQRLRHAVELPWVRGID
jgi:predicted nucleic acid-binding protein